MPLFRFLSLFIKPVLASLTILILMVTARAEDTTITLGEYGGRPTVDLMINGQGPFSFILDTGAMSTLIDISLAKSLKLPLKRQTQIGSMNGNDVPSGLYTFESVTVGGQKVAISGAASVDLLGMMPAGENRPLGVVSYWQLGVGVSTLDLSGNTLTLSPQATLDKNEPGTLAMQQPPGYPFPVFEIELAGTAMLAHIDTGSPRPFLLDPKDSKALPLLGELAEMGSAVTVSGKQTFYGAGLDGTATVGTIIIENPELLFFPGLESVNIGTPVFADRLLRIDHNNNLLRFDEKPEA